MINFSGAKIQLISKSYKKKRKILFDKESNPVKEGFVDLDILGLGGLGNENIGEKNGKGEENDYENHTLLQPTLGLPHPGNVAELSFLGAH